MLRNPDNPSSGLLSRKSILGLPGPRHGVFNPYQGQLYEEMEVLGWTVEDYGFHLKPKTASIVHLHWPEAKWSAPSSILALVRGLAFVAECEFWRRSGCRIVWTAHNADAHDVRLHRMSGMFWRQLHKRCDGVVFLSPSSIPQLCERYPIIQRLPHVVIQHGDYRNVLTQAVSREYVRSKLGLNQNASFIGFVGHLKPYKGIDRLLTAFHQLKESKTFLLLAGKPDGSQEIQDVLVTARKTPNCYLDAQFVSDAQMQQLVEACDLLVFPYRRILNSGSVIYALSVGRPVLVPDLPIFKELQRQATQGAVQLYQGELNADILRGAVANAERMLHRVEVRLPSWKSIALAHAEFFQSLFAHRGAGDGNAD